MLDQDKNFYLIHLNTLITSLLDIEIVGRSFIESLLGVKELTNALTNENVSYFVTSRSIERLKGYLFSH